MNFAMQANRARARRSRMGLARAAAALSLLFAGPLLAMWQRHKNKKRDQLATA